ncbi:MAG: sigma-70 family RNA polymerase sigma factor [Planctomycetes bacterium]|nr:sigma-70 family RNA polymerase sigma factor [Planctomycetota bacterium]
MTSATPRPDFAGELERWHARFREAAEVLARRLLGDAEEARDAVQQAFLQAWRTNAKPRDLENPWGWFARIVANACRDRLRARRARELASACAHAKSSVEPASGPDAALDEKLRAERVAAALARLPAPLREIVELKHYAELSFAEVASALGEPVPTVKSRMARALELLRVALKDLEA